MRRLIIVLLLVLIISSCTGASAIVIATTEAPVEIQEINVSATSTPVILVAETPNLVLELNESTQECDYGNGQVQTAIYTLDTSAVNTGCRQSLINAPAAVFELEGRTVTMALFINVVEIHVEYQVTGGNKVVCDRNGQTFEAHAGWFNLDNWNDPVTVHCLVDKFNIEGTVRVVIAPE